MELDKSKIKFDITLQEYEEIQGKIKVMERMIDRTEEQVRKDVIKEIQYTFNARMQIVSMIVGAIMALILKSAYS